MDSQNLFMHSHNKQSESYSETIEIPEEVEQQLRKYEEEIQGHVKYQQELLAHIDKSKAKMEIIEKEFKQNEEFN